MATLALMMFIIWLGNLHSRFSTHCLRLSMGASDGALDYAMQHVQATGMNRLQGCVTLYRPKDAGRYELTESLRGEMKS